MQMICTESQRLSICEKFMDIVNLLRSNDPKSRERLRPFIPLYRMTLNYRPDGEKDLLITLFYFTYLDRQKKGKKRVYISTNANRCVYIRYLTRGIVQKLCSNEVDAKWAVDLLGDRWVITSDEYKFKTVFQLLNHTIALEKKTSRGNRPPEGDMIKKWIPSESLVNSVSQYRSIKSNFHVYGVALRPVQI